MVLWKTYGRLPVWKAFGFFGEGGNGKTALSFTFARLLFEEDKILIKKGTALKVIDDNFYLENGTVWCKDPWGSSDKLGKRQQFIASLKAFDKSLEAAVHPDHERFCLGKLVAWLLLSDSEENNFRIQLCTRDEFVDKLHNPCHQPSQNEIEAQPALREQIRNSFNPSWQYSIIHRKNTRSGEDAELIERLAQEARQQFECAPLDPTFASDKIGVYH